MEACEVPMKQSAAEKTVLVADDDQRICKFLGNLLSERGYRVSVAYDGEEALGLIEKDPPDVALIDLKMPKIDGLELLRILQEKWPGVVSIMITAHGTLDSAIEATKLGVYEYIKKPCENDQIISAVERAFEKKQFDDETNHA
jgi:DNA-binding NtrC family response regulator